MSFKERFKFLPDEKCWMFPPFVITKAQYESCDWKAVDIIIEDFLKSKAYFIDEGKRALLNYANGIAFFSKEELDELGFDFSSVRLLFKHENLVGVRLLYSVDNGGTQKIPWKDLYGIWVVEFIGRNVNSISRVTMLDF